MRILKTAILAACVAVGWGTALGQSPSGMRLNNGAVMPRLGFGTMLLGQGEGAERMVEAALGAGYRLIDTAHSYRNDDDVGEAIRRSGIPREQLWVSATVTADECVDGRADAAIDSLLQAMGLEYLDLVYMRKPMDDSVAGWQSLERALAEGKTRAIGISNFDFDEKFYAMLVDSMRVKPDVVQVVCSAFSAGRGWLNRLEADGVAMSCLYPLEGDLAYEHVLSDPLMSVIASHHGRTPGQVVMRWHLQQGYAIVPATNDIRRLRELGAVGDFELSEAEMETVAMLMAHVRPNPVLNQVHRLIDGYILYQR